MYDADNIDISRNERVTNGPRASPLYRFACDGEAQPFGRLAHITAAKGCLRAAAPFLKSPNPACPSAVVRTLSRTVRELDAVLVQRERDGGEKAALESQWASAGYDTEKGLPAGKALIFLSLALFTDAIGACAYATAMSLMTSAAYIVWVTGMVLFPAMIGGLAGTSLKYCHASFRGSTTRLVWATTFAIALLAGAAYLTGTVLVHVQLESVVALIGSAVPTMPCVIIFGTAAVGLALSFVADYAVEDLPTTRMRRQIAFLDGRIVAIDDEIMMKTRRVWTALDERATYAGASSAHAPANAKRGRLRWGLRNDGVR